MAAGIKTRVTAEEFEAFERLPENTEKKFELIGGEIVEMPSNAYSSEVAARISGELYLYLKNHPIGHVTGEQGGYRVFGERYAPDVAFISFARQPQLAREGYNPNPPELAVEVVSPHDDAELLSIKIGNYLGAGALVWVVYPEKKEVHVFAVGQPVKILDVTDTLDGGDVLPNFTLAIKDIFPE